MEDEHKIYWSALAKYFSGNASEDDKILVHEKRKQDPTFEEAFQQAEHLWLKPPVAAGEYEPDVEGGWQRLKMKARMREVAKPVATTPSLTVPKRNFPYAVAASIVFLLTIGVWLLLQNQQSEWVDVQTAQNETRKFELPDGSLVSLNENSLLSYPENFQLENREVRLKGEAYFKVQKAEGKRFTVYAQNTKTEVIGTAFYLKAYPDEEVKIQVTHGKVAFASTETEEAVFLTPGQEAVLKSGILVPLKQEAKDVNFQAWESRKLVFENTELKNLVKTLEQYFNTSILIKNDALGNCRFTASFEDPDLEEVLEIISITGNLTISKEQGHTIIAGQACH